MKNKKKLEIAANIDRLIGHETETSKRFRASARRTEKKKGRNKK